MLIEFSVANYKSFREKQTLSMIAAPRLRKKDCVIKPNVAGENLPGILKVAAIYGPNASGKSNLISATQVLRKIIRPTQKIEKKLPVVPFKFDKELEGQPSEFEIQFIANNKRYEFNVKLTKDRIFEEVLYQHPADEPLYSRKYETNSYTYKFSDSLEGGRELHEIWKDLTNPTRLFITQAVNNSSEEFSQLRIPYNWLYKGLLPVDADTIDGLSSYVQQTAKKQPEMCGQVAEFLQSVDVPVTKIRLESISEAIEEQLKELDEDSLEAIRKNIENTKTTLTHKTDLGEADFDIEEESMGTKNLIGFWLPWEMMSIEELFSGLVVDELDASLHPNIVASLVEQHIKRATKSQLIFTTHDTHLMDTKLLRRDQLWLTERDMNGATTLTSIYDYEGRESEDVEKRYFEGRYRGLPILRKRF